MTISQSARDARLWCAHDAAWRHPAAVASLWSNAGAVDPKLLRFTALGGWWEMLAALDATLLVTREYEHLLVALRAGARAPEVSFLPLPHPSGLAVDRRRDVVHVASTRNPNIVFDLEPVATPAARDGQAGARLVPVRSRYLPGSLYLHDLAIVGDTLHANAVGQNAVVRLHADGRYEPAWWPLCIEAPDGPRFDRNYLQLNSIAAGPHLASSFFTASAAQPTARRPGHRNFPVDGRGVVFAGASREPITSGLTRPHSARLYGGTIWLCNSGYGEVGFIDRAAFVPVARLPGWTRGLCFHGEIAFVGTSRVFPRFRHYAPGIDADASTCGIHAVDVRSGVVLGSITWPFGNQIFAIDWLPASVASGLPATRPRRGASNHEREIFSSFVMARTRQRNP